MEENKLPEFKLRIVRISNFRLKMLALMTMFFGSIAIFLFTKMTIVISMTVACLISFFVLLFLATYHQRHLFIVDSNIAYGKFHAGGQDMGGGHFECFERIYFSDIKSVEQEGDKLKIVTSHKEVEYKIKDLYHFVNYKKFSDEELVKRVKMRI